MNHGLGETKPDDPGRAAFATTQWGMVLSAGHDSAPDARSALEQLCGSYWYPLYAFLRRSGHAAADAEDLIQGFFESLIERDWLAAADPAKGRFRSFLLVCLKRFVGGEVRKVQAQKRGGRSLLISLDDENAAGRYALENADELAPDEVYDRRWALTVLEQAWDRLRTECESTGKLELFALLRPASGNAAPAPSQKEVASRLGLTESAVKSALFRLRARYRELLREEVGRTVRDPGDVDAEIRHLLAVVSR